jgi:hypothetical protein
MSDNLLHSIQTEAVDSSSDLAGLLRKCRILAQRLGNEDLKKWVVAELDGYPPDGPFPDYRVHRTPIIHGQYVGPYGTGASNVQIPYSAVREDLQELIVPVRFHQGVGELEALVENQENRFLHVSVPPEAINVIRYENVAPHLVLASVKKIIATAVIQGVLSTIRNRILNFTLELEEFAPTTGDPLKSLRDEKGKDVQRIFMTEIRGNVGNLNQAGDNPSQNA